MIAGRKRCSNACLRRAYLWSRSSKSFAITALIKRSCLMYISHFHLHWNVLLPNFQNRPAGRIITDLRTADSQENNNLFICTEQKLYLFLIVFSQTPRAAARSLPRLRSNLAQYAFKCSNSLVPSWGERNSAASWYYMPWLIIAKLRKYT